jgi:3-oxoacyl-[acyl-carrier protein] reductase
MNNRLNGKTALITGASRGIGRAIALRFAQEGADLALAARTAGDLESLQAEIESLGRRCVVFPRDLRDAEQVRDLAQASQDVLGPLDILVNNAGVGAWGRLGEITLEQFDDMFDVNMRALFVLTQAVLPSMLARGCGDIINIASTSGRWTYPTGTVYCASKYAVVGFTEALMKELRTSGVRVTAICPGQVNTYLGGRRPEEFEEGALNSEDVAEMALQAVCMPPHAIVAEMVVWPRLEGF